MSPLVFALIVIFGGSSALALFVIALGAVMGDRRDRLAQRERTARIREQAEHRRWAAEMDAWPVAEDRGYPEWRRT